MEDEVCRDNQARLIATEVMEPLLKAMISLTPRQQQVFFHRISSGDPNRKRIAKKVGVCSRTLERDIARICEVMPNAIPFFRVGA
jgi:FixJ family two-component response regulator